MTGAEIKTAVLTPRLNEVSGSALGQEGISNYVLSYGNGLVPSLCQGIIDDRGFDRLPILADALEEAGYGDGRVLSFLRGEVPEKYLIPQTVLEVVELFRSLGGCNESTTAAYLEHLQP